MAKYCPECKIDDFPDDMRFCPQCGGKLVDKPTASASSFNLNLGDANAVSGGIHLADSHAVDSHDVHNETHNVTNNTWITQQDRPMSFEEIKAEREKEFRQIVRDAYEDGVINAAEQETIVRRANDLGLDEATANLIISQENSFSYRRVKDRPLDEEEYNLIKIVQSCIRANDREGLLELVDDLKTLNLRLDNGLVQYFYYMLMAALMPGEFIKSAEEKSVSIDSFWRTVWLSMAYRSVGSRRPPMLDFKYYQYISSNAKQIPGNVELAQSMDYLKESLTTKTKYKADVRRNSAKEKYKVFESNHQSFLDELGNAISAILEEKTYPLESKFYMDSFFPEAAKRFAVAQAKKQMDEEIFLPLSDIPPMPKISLYSE